MFDSLWPNGLEHTRLLCPPLSPGVCLNSCPLSQWWYWTISFSATSFSFYCQSFPASVQFSSVQSLSHVWLFATLRTAARQASLSITNFRSLCKLMPIELVMPSNHLILCHPLLLPPSIIPASRSFPVSWFFASGGQSIGVSASTSVLPMNI